MGGYSEAVDCPRCDSTESLERSIDSDDISGCCMECGYMYYTAFSVMTLYKVNEERVEAEQEPLTTLKSPVEGWKD